MPARRGSDLSPRPRTNAANAGPTIGVYGPLVMHGSREPADPRKAAVFDELKPYAAAIGAVGILGAPVEIVVPIVRRLRGETGVSMGPGLVNLANGLVVVAVVGYFRRRPAQWERWKGTVPAWLGGLVYLLPAPATAAGWQRGVILRRRSPLWGELISPIGLLQVALMTVVVHRLRRLQKEVDRG